MRLSRVFLFFIFCLSPASHANKYNHSITKKISIDDFPAGEMIFPNDEVKNCIKTSNKKIQSNKLLSLNKKYALMKVEAKFCQCMIDTILEIGFKKLGPKSNESRIALYFGRQELTQNNLHATVSKDCTKTVNKEIITDSSHEYWDYSQVFEFEVKACQSSYRNSIAKNIKNLRVNTRSKLKAVNTYSKNYCQCVLQGITKVETLHHKNLTPKIALLQGIKNSGVNNPKYFDVLDTCEKKAYIFSKKSI